MKSTYIPGLAYHPHYFLLEECNYLLLKIDKLPWRKDLRRRVQHYGYVYDYRKRKVDRSMYLGKLPDFLDEIADMLMVDGTMSYKADQVIVNEYLPGQGISAHIDCTPCFQDEIVTISLGSEYEMDFIALNTKKTLHLDLAVGSLLLLKDEARYKWMHRIVSRSQDHGKPRGRRVSVTFRKVIL